MVDSGRIWIAAGVAALLGVGGRPGMAQGTAAQQATRAAGARTGGGPSVTVDKPMARTVTTGACRIVSDGTLSASWGPASLPTLGFTIGPGAAMADEMHANKAPFVGPGQYKNVIVAVYLGKTALVDSYGGLGTIVVNPDGRSGSFASNDGKTSGHWDCGAAPTR